MYNLNVNMPMPNLSSANTLSVESTSVAALTPRTPEILNSLIAMTNPLETYNKDKISNVSGTATEAPSDSNKTLTTPSVQSTCSQLIKAGLKLTIEQKRKQLNCHNNNSNSGSEGDDLFDLDSGKNKWSEGSVGSGCMSSPTHHQGLTPEDEERRRRRRERNKIAATKCRLKKREKTVNLVHESEVLETQNVDLKSQIHQLESQRRQLLDTLHLHSQQRAQCLKSSCAYSDVDDGLSLSLYNPHSNNNVLGGNETMEDFYHLPTNHDACLV